jgi:hypothetical protein
VKTPKHPKVVGDEEQTKRLFKTIASQDVNAELTKRRSVFRLMSVHNKTEAQARKLLGLPLHDSSK